MKKNKLISLSFQFDPPSCEIILIPFKNIKLETYIQIIITVFCSFININYILKNIMHNFKNNSIPPSSRTSICQHIHKNDRETHPEMSLSEDY